MAWTDWETLLMPSSETQTRTLTTTLMETRMMASMEKRKRNQRPKPTARAKARAKVKTKTMDGGRMPRWKSKRTQTVQMLTLRTREKPNRRASNRQPPQQQLREAKEEASRESWPLLVLLPLNLSQLKWWVKSSMLVAWETSCPVVVEEILVVSMPLAMMLVTLSTMMLQTPLKMPLTRLTSKLKMVKEVIKEMDQTQTWTMMARRRTATMATPQLLLEELPGALLWQEEQVLPCLVLGRMEKTKPEGKAKGKGKTSSKTKKNQKRRRRRVASDSSAALQERWQQLQRSISPLLSLETTSVRLL
mmetsp:Transcript_127593/g.190192  ORF Transcript_127593/g.190192 Transcript_127593/m.190192 type:complete len:304 (+) Transcript_127593:938-1849(+)